MTKLTGKQFQQGALYLKTKARPLERVLFEYEFENGSAEKVLDEVKAFQNNDGGFGRGMEPDFRCTDSSALATSIALQHLAEAGIKGSDETVRKGIHYLLDTFDKEKQGWQIVPRAVENAPRAVWWNYSEDWEWGNPSAEIIGLLHHYRELVPAEFLADLTRYAVTYVNSLTNYESHELLCFLKMHKQLPVHQQAAITEKLTEMVKECVTIDPEEWDSYCLQPLQVVSSPSSAYSGLFKEVVSLNLAYLVRKQTNEGYWDPTWTWGQFEEDWKIAMEEWRGSLTLNNLRVLQTFDYVEN